MRGLEQHPLELVEDVRDRPLARGIGRQAVQAIGGEELLRARPGELPGPFAGRRMEQLHQHRLGPIQVVAHRDEQDPVVRLRDGGTETAAPPRQKRPARNAARATAATVPANARRGLRDAFPGGLRPIPILQARRDPPPDLPAIALPPVGDGRRIDRGQETPEAGHAAAAGEDIPPGAFPRPGRPRSGRG